MAQLLQAGLNVTAIGMGVVFVLLTLLVFIIRGMSALCRTIEGARPEQLTASGPNTPQQLDAQLVGVISAAIAAHRNKR